MKTIFSSANILLNKDSNSEQFYIFYISVPFWTILNSYNSLILALKVLEAFPVITKTININSMDKIKTFVDIINKFNGRFDLVSGCSVVNAKSIMAIFSLDISRPVYLYIYNEESAEHVTKALADFEVNALQTQEQLLA